MFRVEPGQLVFHDSTLICQENQCAWISINLRIYWKHSTILKTSSKSVSSNDFWYLEKYIFWNFIEDAIMYWDKTNIHKIHSDKINFTKMQEWSSEYLFLYAILNQKVNLFKGVWEIFHFRFFLSFIKVCFCSLKSVDSLILKRQNFFHIKTMEKPHTGLLTDF